MASAAIYFFNANNGEATTLFKRVTPSEPQMSDQRDRWNDVAEVIKPRLRERSGYPIRHWLQGSYKFGTQIRPTRDGEEFDIDLGIYFCWNGEQDDGDHGPADLKRFVREELIRYSKENDDAVEVTDPKERCERIRFEGDFHIDVPTYHLDEQRDVRHLATGGDAWEASDPKAFYAWFKNSFDDPTRARARRLIVYLKAWAALKLPLNGGRPSSVLLTVLGTEAIAAADAELPIPDDEAFAHVVHLILVRLQGVKSVTNPVDHTEDFAARMSNADWVAFKTEFATLANVANAALQARDEVTACQTWTIAFEHFFPLPPREELERANALVPLTMPDINVVATSKDNSHLTFHGRNRVGPIPKNCRIEFEVINVDSFPVGTDFFWMVRNDGAEADDQNDLGHASGEGIHNFESSAYNGTHMMDCTARYGGRIVGVRRVEVQIAAQQAPKRARSRPDWTRLRIRRRG